MLDADGRVLACRRAPGRSMGGFWEFPGGKIEIGEAPEQALRRELMEELAVDVKVGEPLEPVVWEGDTTRIRLSPFLCRISGGTLVPIEHDEIRWCAWTELADLEWAPADRPIVNEFITRNS
ncbi:(deoxy)nucleoside triphosphate pyrophosphohydrolase [Luteolibacter pohnpeiensis]